MDYNEYITVAGKKLRKGYTTGSCAAAAAKAAAQMLITGRTIDHISIDTPAGVRLTLPLSDVICDGTMAGCSVKKDGGDDPDVTNGLKIFAEARFTGQEGVQVEAGEGIGTVTLPGLKIKPGKPAINPVPMQMIVKETTAVLPPNQGVRVIISAPGGEAIALRTFNPKLGITGGISILGTTGIEEPMSEEALKESLALELGMKAQMGIKKAAFVFGNYGESLALQRFHIQPQSIIKISNFVGFMLDKADEYQYSDILVIGHIGKLAKVAAGIFHTHSRMADARREILCAYAALEGAETGIIHKIYQCRTTEAAIEIITENGLKGVYTRIGENAAQRCREHTFGHIRIGIILYAGSDILLYMNDEAREMIEELK